MFIVAFGVAIESGDLLLIQARVVTPTRLPNRMQFGHRG